MYFCIGNIARSLKYTIMHNSDFFPSVDRKVRLRKICPINIFGVDFNLSYFMYDDSMFSRDFRRGFVLAPAHEFDAVDPDLSSVSPFLVSPDLAELIYNVGHPLGSENGC